MNDGQNAYITGRLQSYVSAGQILAGGCTSYPPSPPDQKGTVVAVHPGPDDEERDQNRTRCEVEKSLPFDAQLPEPEKTPDENKRKSAFPAASYLDTASGTRSGFESMHDLKTGTYYWNPKIAKTLEKLKVATKNAYYGGRESKDELPAGTLSEGMQSYSRPPGGRLSCA